jgi:hypothetical protein
MLWCGSCRALGWVGSRGLAVACGGACDGRPHYSSLWMCNKLLVWVVVGRSLDLWLGLFVFTQAKCVLAAVPPSVSC